MNGSILVTEKSTMDAIVGVPANVRQAVSALVNVPRRSLPESFPMLRRPILVLDDVSNGGGVIWEM